MGTSTFYQPPTKQTAQAAVSKPRPLGSIWPACCAHKVLVEVIRARSRTYWLWLLTRCNAASSSCDGERMAPTLKYLLPGHL